MPEETGWWQWIYRLKTAMEILAIFVGAVWAGTLWYYYERPSNVARGDLRGELHWYAHTKDLCQAEYFVEFKNIGKVNVQIARAVVSAWTLPRLEDLKQTEEIRLLDDPFKVFSGPPVMTQPTQLLVGNFASDERESDGIPFIVKRSPPRLMLFKVDMWKEGFKEGDDPSWSDYRWDWVCGENPSTTPTATPPH